jgi:hypothetical protein
MRKALFILCVIFWVAQLFAQDKSYEFYLGYNTAVLKSIPEHFKYVNLSYQETYDQGKFALSPFAFGVVAGFRLNFTRFPVSMDYAWVRKEATSNIAYFPQYKKYAQYKMSYGNSSLGFIFGKRNKPFRVGINFDFGRIRLTRKRYERSEFRFGKWVDYVATTNMSYYKGKSYMGVNLYALFQWKFLEFRPYITFGTKEYYPNYTTFEDFPIMTTNMGLFVSIFPSRFKN